MRGLHRSPNQISAFLKRLGLKRRKVRFVPGKSDTPEKMDEQETFREDTLELLLVKAQNGNQAVSLSIQPILYTPLFRIFVEFCSVIY